MTAIFCVDCARTTSGNCGRHGYLTVTQVISAGQPRTDADAIRAFVARVNARAEADMLAGGPITGAHHRAIEVELAALENTLT